jgi:4-amino-4-deoxy-L-arabinose transferase-like glycosyltransferase
MPLTFTITLALGSFYLSSVPGATRRAGFLWSVAGYTALGLGLLLKGPIAVVLPACVLVACHVAKWRGLLPHQALSTRYSVQSLWWGVPWMLAIAAPWYLWANAQTDNRLWEVFFWYHNIERGLGGAEALAAHPWWFYLPRTAVDLLPWSLALPAAFYGLWRDAEMRREETVWLGLLWFAAMLLFLSLMRFKRADYLLPAYPGLAIFLGVWMERCWQARPLARVAFASIVLVYGIGWQLYHVAIVQPQERDWPHRTLAEEIRRQTRGPIIFFRAEAHLLAYHLGQPVATVLEWENLEVWAHKPFPVYVVMPETCAREWPQHLPAGVFDEVLQTKAYVHGPRDRPLVVLRNHPQP